jgi:hypothetical protein
MPCPASASSGPSARGAVQQCVRSVQQCAAVCVQQMGNKMVAMMVLVVTAWLGSVNALEIEVAQASLDSHAEQTLLGQGQSGKSDNADGGAEVDRAMVGSEMQSETGSLAQTVQRDAARGAGSLRVETGGGASATLRGHLATLLESGHETSNVLEQRSAESGHSTSGCVAGKEGTRCDSRCPVCMMGLTCHNERCITTCIKAGGRCHGKSWACCSGTTCRREKHGGTNWEYGHYECLANG